MNPTIRTWMNRLQRFNNHPVTKLVLGLILVATSISDGYDAFFTDLGHLRFRPHHGLFVLGLANVLACLPHLVEGLDRTFEAIDARRARSASGSTSPSSGTSPNVESLASARNPTGE